MKEETLRDILRRAEAWPEAAQEALLEAASEIEAELSEGVYHATPEELAGIDRGLEAAGQGRFATSGALQELFSRYRRG